jgi:hypothetical protein
VAIIIYFVSSKAAALIAAHSPADLGTALFMRTKQNSYPLSRIAVLETNALPQPASKSLLKSR